MNNTDYNQLQTDINTIKQILNNTDHFAIQAFEGDPHPQWEQIKVERQRARNKLKEIKVSLQAIVERPASGTEIRAAAMSSSLDSSTDDANINPVSLLAMIDFIPWDLKSDVKGGGIHGI